MSARVCQTEWSFLTDYFLSNCPSGLSDIQSTAPKETRPKKNSTRLKNEIIAYRGATENFTLQS